jgi:hypothetical protein
MTENTQDQDKAPTAPTQQEVAQASDTKAEAKAIVELSEDDLEAVAGGAGRGGDQINEKIFGYVTDHVMHSSR